MKHNKQEIAFESIYQLAKIKDEKALTAVIDSIAYISFFQGEDTQVMRLAKEGDIESVMFLIDKFKASINYAVRGSASAGHIAHTNNLIKRGGNIDYAVWGAACGGHVQFANELLGRKANLNFAVFGAASGNHIAFTNELISHDASLSYAGWGAAFGGHAAFTNELINRGASLNNAAHGAAFGGHVELTNELIEGGAKLNNALQGAASGGHIALTNDLIIRGGSINHAVQGAAGGGFIGLINELIDRGADLKFAVRGVENWEHNFQTQEEILRYISFINNLELRSLLIKKTKKILVKLNITTLLQQAAKINLLMLEKNCSYNQARRYLTKSWGQSY